MKPTKSKLAKIRLELLQAAQEGGTVTYGRLMKRYGLSRGRVLSKTIGDVDRAELRRGAPGFAAIIVRKDTGFPGGGYFCDEDLPPDLRRPRHRSSDQRISVKESEHIRLQQKRTWSYYARKGQRSFS